MLAVIFLLGNPHMLRTFFYENISLWRRFVPSFSIALIFFVYCHVLFRILYIKFLLTMKAKPKPLNAVLYVCECCKFRALLASLDQKRERKVPFFNRQKVASSSPCFV
jgi:hypothetical protein